MPGWRDGRQPSNNAKRAGSLREFLCIIVLRNIQNSRSARIFH
nr:MAG TPA: hypothetical protein [Caudoviricetes sp.]